MYRLVLTSRFLSEGVKNHLRRLVQEVSERLGDQGEKEQRWRKPARECLGMIERRCLGRQLTEDHVQVGDDDQGDRRADGEPHRCLDRERQIAEQVGEHVANR